MKSEHPAEGGGLPASSGANKNGKNGKIHNLIHRLPDSVRNEFIAMSGEYVGTVLFLFFALSGTQVANNIPSSSGQTVAQSGSNPQQLQYIALAFGFSLAVNAWVFFRITGGLFNPAVTLGMCLIGGLPIIRAILLAFSQILGGITAAALVSCMFPGPLNVSTSLGGGTSTVQGLFIEMFLTAELVFTIFMLAAEKHKGTFIAPIGIGLAMFIAELTGVYFTGGSLNPARSFGPAVVLTTFEHYHWIYWVGPILGAFVAAGFYSFIKVLEFETANPDQEGGEDYQIMVQKRKELLIAAGINEDDAAIVAADLSNHVAETMAHKQDGPVLANGRGRADANGSNQPMYGTQYKNNSRNGGFNMPERPGAYTSGSQVGRYSHLGRSDRQGSYNATPPRSGSPVVVPAPVENGHTSTAPRGAVGRTNSGIV